MEQLERIRDAYEKSENDALWVRGKSTMCRSRSCGLTLQFYGKRRGDLLKSAFETTLATSITTPPFAASHPGIINLPAMLIVCLSRSSPSSRPSPSSIC